MLQNLIATFQNVFETNEHPRCFFAPGRINLIGEHTDYNGGYVFPAAISLGTYALATKRSDEKVRLYSTNFAETGIIECSLDQLDYIKSDDWANYPKGMITYIHKQTKKVLTGMDILYEGNIPNGAGLSSSASIEMVTGILLKQLFAIQMDPTELSLLGKKVENEYVGVSSGIMDQFVIAHGKEGYAIHLNADTLDYTYAPLDLTEHTIVIINTNKTRTLASSKYNERRQSCNKALKDLQRKLTVSTLGEVTPTQFEQWQHVIVDDIHRKRARHVIFENERTKQAYKKLTSNQLDKFGQLMNESHVSLRSDFEVTGKELDTIVEAAWKQQGVIGARMTGAGFGGCAIAIVENTHLISFKENIASKYKQEIGYGPTIYTPKIVDGARELTKERMV